MAARRHWTKNVHAAVVQFATQEGQIATDVVASASYFKSKRLTLLRLIFQLVEHQPQIAVSIGEHRIEQRHRRGPRRGKRAFDFSDVEL